MSSATAFGWPVERGLSRLVVGQGNSESGPELEQLLLVEFLLPVGDVAALARFAEAVSLDGARQNDCWLTLVIDRSLERCVDL